MIRLEVESSVADMMERMASLGEIPCVVCAGETADFTDDITREVFWDTGVCQTCQDKGS